MAFESQLPALRPQWAQEGYFPVFLPGDGANLTFVKNRWWWRHGAFNLGDPDVDGATVGGTGVTKEHRRQRDGVVMPLLYTTTSAVAGDLWRPPCWPQVANGGAVVGNIIGREDQRCIWFRIPWLDTGMGDVENGLMFLFHDSGLATVPWPSLGSAYGMFGIVGDGAGGMQYRSCDTGGAELEAVPFARTVSEWNYADFIFISSAPGRQATFELRVNGDAVVVRDIGSALLPGIISSTDMRLGLVTRMTTSAAALYLAYIHLRMGAYTPDGLELPA